MGGVKEKGEEGVVSTLLITRHRMKGEMCMKRSKKIVALLVIALFFVSIAPAAFSAEGNKVNINTASVEELITLDRIGQKYAERIIQYRETNGPFVTVEDITMVKGIGQKTLDANRDRMTVK